MKPAILENDRVEDCSAAETAPPGERRHAETDLQIHERLSHHQIVTAWASYDEVGFYRTPTHASLPSSPQREASLMQQVLQEGQPKCWLGLTTRHQSKQGCATEAQDYSQT